MKFFPVILPFCPGAPADPTDPASPRETQTRHHEETPLLLNQKYYSNGLQPLHGAIPLSPLSPKPAGPRSPLGPGSPSRPLTPGGPSTPCSPDQTFCIKDISPHQPISATIEHSAISLPWLPFCPLGPSGPACPIGPGAPESKGQSQEDYIMKAFNLSKENVKISWLTKENGYTPGFPGKPGSPVDTEKYFTFMKL